MTSRQQPTHEEWAALFAASSRFLKAKPWTSLDDGSGNGVVDPETGEVARCVVMGSIGRSFGLVAFEGEQGAAGFAVMTGEVGADEDEMQLSQFSHSFSLGDREATLPEDRLVYKSLGLSYRGRGAWPLFRRNRPGYLPVLPDGQGARSLTRYLEQTVELFESLTDGSSELQLPSDQMLCRRRTADGAWQTVALDAPEPRIAGGPDLDAADIAEVVGNCGRAELTWQAKTTVVGLLAGEAGDDPFFGRLLLVVDRDSQFVLTPNIMTPHDWPQAALLDGIRKFGSIPRTIEVKSDLLARQLAGVTDPLGIDVRRVRRLPTLDRIARELTRMFGR